MSHYLTKEECKARSDELRARQEADPSYDLKLTFIKDENGWYADVQTHTRSENAMVCGAEKMLDIMAAGKRKLKVSFRCVKDPSRKELALLKRIVHTHGFGGTYLVLGVTVIPFPVWLCDVCHDVTGEHPKKIYVYGIC